MNERLRILRKDLGLSQEEFGRRINLSKPTISTFEVGSRPMSDRVISDICREYNVNEEWFRFGTGDMYLSEELDLVERFAQVSKEGNSDLQELTKILWDLDEDEIKLLLKLIRKIKSNPTS